jgi:hypothetical protein
MKTQARSVIALLFPHQDDPAYQKLADFEELVAPWTPSNSTTPMKQRLQRAIARLSESLVDYADIDSDPDRERMLLLGGLRDCRKAANAVHLLYRARVIARVSRVAAFELLADIAQLLIERLHALLGLPPPGMLPRPLLVDVVSEPSSEAGSPNGQKPPDA